MTAPALTTGLYSYVKSDRAAVWLLDVDGVLNIEEPRGWDGYASTALVRNTLAGRRYRLTWAPQVIEFVRDRGCALGDIDIRWATTWCGSTRALEELWDMPWLIDALDIATPLPPRIRGPRIRGPWIREVKLAAARQVLANGDRLIWTDDQCTPLPGSDLYEELTADGRALLIRPYDVHGLEPGHLDAIDEFMRGAR